MMIAFDPALTPKLSGRAAGLPPSPLAPAEAGLDFAALLADRALLDAPTGAANARGTGGEARAPRAMAAPVALRFDEGPLFGQAFLQDNLAAPGSPGQRIAAAGARLGEAADRGAAVQGSHAAPLAPASGLAMSPRARVHFADGGVPFTPDHGAARGAARVLTDDIADSQGLEGGRDAARDGQGLGAGVAVPGGRPMAAQGDGTPSGAAPRADRLAEPGGRVAALPGSTAEPEASDRGEQGGAARQMRARFVDRLGPVQIVVREDGGMVQLVARVALASAPAANMLERKLREAVAEEGHGLSALRINGEIRPSKARI